jgi:dihydroorotase
MKLTIRKPDDRHLHVRDGAVLEAVMPFTARRFGRAILMPNLIPPMPVIKIARDRDALRKAATSGESCYFLGTDSAPHPVARKLSVNGIPGMFNAPVAIETYAKVFEEEGALDKLEAFASLNGPKHYKLPVNTETITLEKIPWVAPEEVQVEGPDERAIVYRGGETIEWKVTAS